MEKTFRPYNPKQDCLFPRSLDEFVEKDQYNFTDCESSIMKSRGTFEQCYNAQAAVDSESQIIVAQAVTNAANDTQQMTGLVEQIEESFERLPKEVSADAGYFTEDNIEFLEQKNINGYIAPGRETKQSKKAPPPDSLRAQMGAKIRRAGYRSRYRLRKQIVEPVFGQIKHARGFRQFLRRGLNAVSHEWSLLCTAHNLLKLAAARP